VKPRTSLRTALSDGNLLGQALAGDSWSGWRALLLAALGEKLTDEERAHFRRLTQREHPPETGAEEIWCIAGRRGGKSRAIAVLICYLAALCDYRDKLSAGEKGIVLCLAPSQTQAGVVLDYIAGILRESPILAELIVRETSETIELDNGITIDVRSASFRRLRGQTCVACVFDEMAFFHSDESLNPDVEILNAVRPSLGTTSGILAVISSPYARKGALYDAFKNHFGHAGDGRVLVAKGGTRDFNPTYEQAKIDREFARDPAYAMAEFGGDFRVDVETFISREAVQACVTAGVRERPPERQWKYVGFCDPSGGSSDSMTLAIAHKEGATVILDAIREAKPPFSPEAVSEEFSDLLKRYRITRVIGDRYAGEWPREQFRKHGVNYEPSERTKSELYINLLPLVNSRAVDLLDHDRMVMQCVSLERRTGRSGKDSVEHSPGGKDDLINAVAGGLWFASELRGNYQDFHRQARPLSKPISIPRVAYEPGTAWMARR
jgi:hypothetical protein